MQLNIVGGFLGSGKTTAIITAAKHLISLGKKVGVVTNDLGKYLVDTSFFLSNQIPTRGVTNGCFGCNFDLFREKLAELSEAEHPDVIFAEAVGSCGDVVGTVLKPLIELENSSTHPTSFSVFTDSLLLLSYLQGIELPFSENVIYIFQKQIEEAKILVINKIDLLNPSEFDQISTLAHAAYPEKVIHFQNSKSEADVLRWYDLLREHSELSMSQRIKVDFRKFKSGKYELAWQEKEIEIHTTSGHLGSVIEEGIQTMVEELHKLEAPIGHLKFMVSNEHQQIKISFPTLIQTGWNRELAHLDGGEADLLINARIQMPLSDLQDLINRMISIIASKPGVTVKEIH